MKYLYIKLVLLITVMFLVNACEIEDNIQPEGNWELSVPLPKAPDNDAIIVLDENNKDELITFSWSEASSSAGYGVKYSVAIVDASILDYKNPILEIAADNGEEGLTASVSYEEFDTALSLAGYDTKSENNLVWAAVAKSLSKTSRGESEMTVTRFETEIIPTQLFVSGSATEKGVDLAEAISMKRLNNSEGNASNVFEVYTSLSAGESFMFFSEQSLPAHTYGGAEGTLVKNGVGITVEENGAYRISVNLDDNSYTLLKIDRWNVKGSPIIGGWGSDEPLEYIGNGVWQGTMDFVELGGFLIRADVSGGGYWDYLLKRVSGTTNEVVMESQAGSQGLSVEDIPGDQIGTVIVTLDLSADAYSYSIDKDPNAAEPIQTPETLFLFVNNIMVEEMTKEGDVFTNNVYHALQTSDVVLLNTLANGSGESYSIGSKIGVSDFPDAVKVSENAELTETSGDILVERDQAYIFSIDFANAKFTWNYYNILLFHWDEANQKWDDRDEFLLTYEHPFKFNTSVNLEAGFDMKFFSPWDNEFGADNPSDLNGSMTNKGGSNFNNITTSGLYNVSIELTNDFSVGTYEFAQ